MNITTGKSVYLQVCYCCLVFTLQFSNYQCWELSGIKKEKRVDMKTKAKKYMYKCSDGANEM